MVSDLDQCQISFLLYKPGVFLEKVVKPFWPWYLILRWDR